MIRATDSATTSTPEGFPKLSSGQERGVVAGMGPAGQLRLNARRQTTGDLLRRAFDGSAKNLLLGALGAQPASDAELAEIRRILRDLEKKKGSR